MKFCVKNLEFISRAVEFLTDTPDGKVEAFIALLNIDKFGERRTVMDAKTAYNLVKKDKEDGIPVHETLTKLGINTEISDKQQLEADECDNMLNVIGPPSISETHIDATNRNNQNKINSFLSERKLSTDKEAEKRSCMITDNSCITEIIAVDNLFTMDLSTQKSEATTATTTRSLRNIRRVNNPDFDYYDFYNSTPNQESEVLIEQSMMDNFVVDDQPTSSNMSVSKTCTAKRRSEARQYESVDNDLRIKICDYHDSGYGASQISQLLNVKRTTVNAIIKKYMKTGVMEASKRGGCKQKKFLKMHEDAINEWMNEDSSVSLRKLSEKLQEKFSVIVSSATVAKFIGRFHYTLKRLSDNSENRSDDSTIAVRRDYAEKFGNLLSKYSDKQLIFLDSVGFAVAMRTKKIGSEESGNGRVRKRNVSICCALNSDGIVSFCVYRHLLNSQSFLEFFDLLFEELDRKGIVEAILIMPNRIFQKDTEILNDAITEAEHSYLYLPSHSSFLNPIENVFSKWQEIIMNSHPECELDLLLTMSDARDQITSADTDEYYRQMMSYLPQCLNGERIE